MRQLKQITKIVAISLIATIVFSGCAIKQDDHIAIKSVKHTVNSPLYVIFVSGWAGHKALELTTVAVVAVPFYTYNYTSKYFQNKHYTRKLN